MTCCYFLLQKKDRVTYVIMLNFLKELGVDPERVQVDFKMAMIQAIKSVWPSVKVTGCYFHFVQCIVRKMQTLGLMTLFCDGDAVVKYVMQVIAGLPLAKINDLECGFKLGCKEPHLFLL